MLQSIQHLLENHFSRSMKETDFPLVLVADWLKLSNNKWLKAHTTLVFRVFAETSDCQQKDASLLLEKRRTEV
jgi:hypothetical protein